MKAKNLLLILPFVFSSLISASQVWNWAQKLTSPANSGLHGIAAEIDVQGNYVVLSGVDTLWEVDGAPSQNYQFYVSKYDKQGNLLWAKNFAAAGNLYAYDLTTDSAGSIYVLTGKYTRIDGSVYNGPGGLNYLTKLTAMGDFRWAKPLGEFNPYRRKKLKSDGRSVYMLADPSYSNSFQFLDTTFNAPTPPGGFSPEFIFLAKLDSAGVRQWQKVFIDTLGYSWPMAMDVNRKKEIVFSGYFRKKIWLNNIYSVTNPSSSADYQYYAVYNTDNGQLKGYELLGLSPVYPAVSINDSSLVACPRSIGSLTVTLTDPSGNPVTITYPSGDYIIARRIGIPGGPIVAVRKISNFKLNQLYDMASDTANNLFAVSKLFFNNGVSPDSSFLAVSRYKISSNDTNRLAVWQANIDGNYYETGANNQLSVTPSVDTRNGEIGITGGFRNTGQFGPYTVTAISTRNGFIASLKDGFCTISGTVFIDANNNGVYDAGELPVPARIVKTQNNYAAFTDNEGDYKLYTDTGSYVIQLLNTVPYYNTVPASHPVSFNAYGQSAINKNFAQQGALPVNDLEIDVTPVTPARPGRPLTYTITLRNRGTTTLSNKYSLKMGSFLTYASSTVPATVIGDSLVWDYTNFKPFEMKVNSVTCNINVTATAGSIIKSVGHIYPVAGDTTPANNIDTAYSRVTASFDPNDKIVFPVSEIHIDSAQQGRQFLEYIIRFQNTGNDTAFQVKVVDSLTAKLNIQTFELISSSHPVEISQRGQRTFEFYFPNILLPDSNRNEPGSHGFVKFRVKPVTTVTLTDSVYNFADIYFDYNSPVRTNTIATGFRNNIITGTGDPQPDSKNLKVYPNPAIGYFVYKLEKSPRESLQLGLYDISGRIVFSRVISGTGNTITGQIDTDSMPPGFYVLKIRSLQKNYFRKLIIQ